MNCRATLAMARGVLRQALLITGADGSQKFTSIEMRLCLRFRATWPGHSRDNLIRLRGMIALVVHKR
jgi:hypothetical protein